MSTWADKIWLLQIVQQKLARVQTPSAKDIKIQSFENLPQDITNLQQALEYLFQKNS